MAFGPSRHRAWVVGQRALECWLGSRGRSFWGLLEAVLRRLGAVLKPLGASCGPLGASWGPLGAEGSICHFVVPLLGPSWARLGGLLDRLGGLLGRLDLTEARKGQI